MSDSSFTGAVSFTPTMTSANFTSNIRLNSLKTYTPNRIRDTWVVLGSQTVDYNFSLFNRNAVFKLASSATTPGALNGSLFYCDADVALPPTWNWANMVVNDPATNTIKDQTTGIVSPHFFLLISGTQLNAITIPVDMGFQPFQDITAQGVGATPNSLVIIDPQELEQILLPLGVPFISINELEFTPDQILNDMILPALKEFYKWFPIIEMGLYPLQNYKFEIDVPEWAQSCVKAYINPIGPPGGSNVGNPFTYWYEQLMAAPSIGGGISPGMNSTRRPGYVNTMNYGTYILERAVRQGIINYATRTRIKTYIQQGKLRGYSTKLGMLEVQWGCFSNQWADVPFTRLSEVRKLCQAYVLRAFGMLRKQARSDIAGGLDYQNFLETADKYETEVITLWQEVAKASGVVRA